MGYIGIMENEMETTTTGYMGCWVLGFYIGIIENNMETTIMGLY